MREYKIHFSALFILLLSLSASAQTISVDNSKTPTQLVQELFAGGSCVVPTNITITGYDFGGGEKSFASFDSNGSGFPLQKGLLISTGRASSAIGPNSSLLSEGPSSWPGDNDLEMAINENNTINATIVEFDFVAVTNYMSFNYIFSSEQYLSNPSSNQCNYSDGFAFLLNEIGSPANQNLAVVPGTNIPVKVTTVRGSGTVCPAANAQYFDAFNGSNHPTNFNGQTRVMNAEADIIPGRSYHIKMVIADQGNNLYDSAIFIGGNSFNNDYAMGDDRLIADGNPLCPGETLTVTPDYTVPGTLSYSWLKDGAPIPGYTNVSSPTYTINAAGVYTLMADVGSCTVYGYINVEYAPVTANDTNLTECDDNNDAIATFDLTDAVPAITGGNPEMTIQGYYRNLTNAQNQQNAITNPQSYQNTLGNTVIARVENDFGCVDYADITLQVTNSIALNPIAPVKVCDYDAEQDGLYEFDLNAITQLIRNTNTLPAGTVIQYFASQQDAQNFVNALTSPYPNTTPNQQIIYARIANSCSEILPITLTVTAFSSNLQDESVPICNEQSITLDPGSGFNSYSWNTTPVQTSQTITVSQSGNYSVTVTNADGCSVTKTYFVTTSEPPTITGIDTNSFSGIANSITVYVSGSGTYEYSLNDVIYQTSNVFTGVYPGEYTVYVRDIYGCGDDFETTYVLDYPRFFTPNGDGYNDVWKIKNLDTNYPNSRLFIFNRYGKLLKQISSENDGWDGTLENNTLPSDDYWFTLTFENGRIIKGHFSLKR
ncbi:hypothetical protein FSS13T_20370 [Flavobacterium saliperosum S13]|uniref:Gliding motility-associated C-terminal domain-containing protein n=2 Tax=Flavobacterium saliperosum TaxID=329186 RepID=A0A1G4VTI6_9FLAO|nr:choice-of-anchor L domain-containing protein [Flavobacterium saliperosum]ESU24068.1 hypothetical protein FSS13T_20370 [Flavobacterium saliperosum S13]SCX10925.1 gliding motility-associated C-terminal domain-containing protein [Flavobacterium saliperosum]